MSGQPCIRGLPIPVATVVAMVTDGWTVPEIIAELPELEAEDVAQALRYAAAAVREPFDRVLCRSAGTQPNAREW